MRRGKALISICISNLHFQEDFSYNDDDDQIFLRSDNDTLTYITYIFFLYLCRNREHNPTDSH